MRTMRELLAAASAKKSDPDPNLEEFSQVIKPFRPKTWDDVLKADRQAQQESANENSFSDYLGAGVKNALDTFAMQAGLQAQGLGLQIGDLANSEYYKNNPDAPVAKVAKGLGGALGTIGESALDMYNEDASHHTSEEWMNTALGDILSNPELRGRYFSDPQGFAAEFGSGLGSAGEFAAITAALSRLGLGKVADKVSGKALSGASSLLSKANLPELATMAGSDLAKSLFGTTLQFGLTMGPAGALTNAATTIDAQRQQGKSNEEIAAANRAMMSEEMPYDVAFAGLTGNVAKGLVGKAIAPENSTAWQKALANAAGVPLEGAGGYYSNVEQMILADKYSGNPYGTLGNPTPNESAAGRMGVIAGLPFSAYGGVRGYLNAKAKENAQAQNEEVSKAFSDLYQSFRQDFNDNAATAETQARQSFQNAVREQEQTAERQSLRSWANNISGGKMSGEVYDSIVRNAQELGVDVKHALAQAVAESNGNQDVTSEVGAIGVMQLMPETARELGVNPDDTEQNIRGGIRYLKQMYERFGDWDLAHAAYNAGMGAVEQYGGTPPYSETRNYVSRINGFLNDSPDYQSTRNEEIYSGENGKGEGKYWLRQNGNVSFEGAQPQLLNAIDALGKFYFENTGKRLVVTAGTNGSHADGEHSHGAGWKVDVNDFGFGEDGALTTPDGGKGWFADEFIKRGQELGLGMNWEGGADNAHIDVALDGTQWDGSTETTNFGGFNPQNNSVQSKADADFKKNYKPQETFADRLNREQPVQSQPPTTPTDNSQITNPPETAQVTEQADTPKDFFSGTFDTKSQVVSTADNFLEQLREEGDPQKASLLFQLQRARNNGDVAAIENILKQNNIAVSSPTQETVETNPPPPKQLSGLEKLIKVASAPVAEGKDNTNKRARQGKALLRLAQQNNIEVPSVDTKALKVGSTIKVQEWRDKFLQAGLFNEPQESAEVKKARRDWTTFKAVSQERGQKIQAARTIADNLFNLSEADENSAAGVAAPVYDSEVMEQLDRKESRQAAQRQWQTNETERIQKQEEYRRWQAKQAKELKELQIRQAEAKRLADESRKREQAAEQQRDELESLFTDADFHAKSAESDNLETEEHIEEKLREEERRDNIAGQKVSPEALRENYRIAQQKVRALENTLNGEEPTTEVEGNNAVQNVPEQPEIQPPKQEKGYSKRFEPAWTKSFIPKGEAFSDGVKLLMKAPAGTQITNAGIGGESHYKIIEKSGKKYIVQTDTDYYARPRVLNYSTLRSLFGNGIHNYVTFPEGYEESAKTQKNKRQSTNDTLHAKLKTDTHPTIKAWLDEKIKEAATPEGKDARGTLKRIKTDIDNLNDTALDNAEENFKRDTELYNTRRRRWLDRNDLSEAQRQALADKESEPTLNFNYPSEKFRELEQKVSQMSDKELQAKVKELLRYENTRWDKEQNAVAEIEDLIRQDDERKNITDSKEQATEAQNSSAPTIKLDEDTFSTFALFLANEIKTPAGRKSFVAVMNKAQNYNGVVETRREHIERLFKEHPEYLSNTAILSRGRKDIYNSKQTDYHIAHDAALADDFYRDGTDFEYVTKAEKDYFEFLQKWKSEIGYEPVNSPELQPEWQELLNYNKTKQNVAEQSTSESQPSPRIEDLNHQDEEKNQIEHKSSVPKNMETFHLGNDPELKTALSQIVLSPVGTKINASTLAVSGKRETTIKYEIVEGRNGEKKLAKVEDGRHTTLTPIKEKMTLADVFGEYAQGDGYYELAPQNIIFSYPEGYSAKLARQEKEKEIQKRATAKQQEELSTINRLKDQLKKDLTGILELNKFPAYQAALFKQIDNWMFDSIRDTQDWVKRNLKSAEEFQREDTSYEKRMAHERRARGETKSEESLTKELEPESERTQREIETLKEQTKQQLYEILEAEKYPSIKEYLDDSFKKIRYDTLESAKRNTANALADARKMKSENHTAKFAAEHLNLQFDHKKADRATSKKAWKIIEDMRADKITGEKALEKLDDLFSGRAEEKYAAKKAAKQERVENLKSSLKNELAQILDLDNHPAFRNKIYQGIDLESRTLESQSEAKNKEWYNSYIELAKKIRDEGKIDSWEERARNEQQKKYSKTGRNVDTRIKNFVADQDLTPQQKLLNTFGQKLGTETVFFDNSDGNFHGAHSNGITYLNVNSKMPLGKVFWHESMHWLKANNSKLYQQLAEAVGITDAQRKAYLEETKRNDLEDNAAIDEEIIADAFEDTAKRSGLLQNISGKNRGLIQRVVQWLKDTMNKFIDHFRNPQGKLTTVQSQALADEFGRIANKLFDSNGEKIFRYNNRIKNIELIDGRELPSTETRNDSKPKYSISANDNSDESTLQRIRNKAAAWFSGRKGLSERRNQRIVQRIEGITNYKIAFNGVDETIVDDFHKVIRAPHAYQWEKFLPAVSEKIAHVLKLPAQKEMANYITDWILTGALNNTSAEATKFQKAMRDDPPTAEALIALHNEFKEITEMTPEERYGEKIVHPQKTLTAKIMEKFTKEEWIDDLAPLQKMIDRIAEDQPELGAELKKGINPLEMARLYRGKGGMISDLMIHGTAKNLDKIKAALHEQYPNVNFKWFKPLDMIIEEAGGQKNLKALEVFAVAKLDKEIFEWNRAHPNEKVTPTNPNEADADAVIKNGEAQFGQAQRDLVSFSRTLLDIQHDAGLITDNQYVKTIKSWQNYIPMARVFDENADYGFMSSLKGEKTGSERDTYTPIGRLIINANEYIRQAERNKIKQELAGLARMGAFAKYIEERDTSKVDAKNHIVFYENGKRKYLQTAPEVVRAVEALGGRTESVMIVKLLHAATKAVTASYTTLNLDFAAGNPFRDLADSYLHNKHIGKNPLPFIMDGFVQIFRGLTGKRADDADFIEWVANGGSQASLVSPDIDYVQRDIDSLGTTFKERFRKNPFSTVLEGLQRVAEHGEQAVRLANYRAARDALAKQRTDGKATVEDKRKAALISREASIDFAKAGRSTRVANRVFAFTNAAVQSWNLDYQRYVEPLFSEEGRKRVWGNYFKLGMMYMVPAVLQAALCYGKDWWKEKKDWEKETYWFFGDTIKIPKGLDVAGRLTAAFTDAALSHWLLNEPVEAKRFATTVKDAMPSLTTTIFTPLIETALNRSWFRQAPIVPASEQHLPAYLQYGEGTSPAAKFFGEQTGVSPRKIDYMINGYFGFLGKFFSGKYLTGDLNELPLVHRFKNVPYKNSKSVQRFYEVYDEQDKLYNGYKLELKRDPKTKPPKELDMALYRRLKRAQEQMQRISKQRKLIESDKKLSSDKREEKLLALEKQRMTLCQRVLNGAR